MGRLTRLARSLAGRAVLVTGAASGMGRATAELFADEGAGVLVTDVSADGAEPVAARIREAGGRALAQALDVTDPAAMNTAVEACASELGGLDVLVNNAGVAVGGTIDADDLEQAWARALDVMLLAQARLVRRALPWLERSGEGRVVLVASTEALGATRGTLPYTVAKHGVVGLTRSLAMELGPRGITVNCVCPGATETAMTRAIPEAARAKFARRRIPLRRYADPEEIAHMVVNLALPSSSYVHGAVIPVDGGLTVQNT